VNKVVFLQRLQRERDKFELLLNQVGFSRHMTTKGVSGSWSIKDILAHIFSYEQYIADRIEEIRNGREYTPSKTHNALDAFLLEHGYPDFGSPLLDDDGPNAWVVEKYRNVSLEDVVAQETNAFSAIISALKNMPENLITQHNLFERVANKTYHHYREHIADIKRWLRFNTIHKTSI